ncbi:MAG: biotin/lipoyl-containing protein [Ignavibacteriaceae bacterium]|nr:biotin/lipoyl-containing protein [Ignavibacteriaceae bacterium]
MNDFVVSVNSSKLNIKVLNDNELTVDDEKFNYELIPVCDHSFILKLNNKVFELTSEKLNSDLFKVLVQGYQSEVTVRTALQEKAFKLLESSASFHHHHMNVKAPMPGLILKIKKNVGEKVEQGESVIILEAMKMENDLKAPASGIIESIFITEGSAVEKGFNLFTIG